MQIRYFNYLTEIVCKDTATKKRPIMNIFQSNNAQLTGNEATKATETDTNKDKFIRGSHFRSPIRLRYPKGSTIQTRLPKSVTHNVTEESAVKHGSWFANLLKTYTSFNISSVQSSPSSSSRSTSTSITKTSQLSNKSNFLTLSTRLSDFTLNIYTFN